MAFAEFAQKYFELGYSIIPVNGKAPYIDNWSEYCDRLPTESEIEKWCDQFPDANIGLACGKASNLIAFDFDYEGADQEKIENIISQLLPPSPVRKCGKKKWTAFYRFNDLPSTYFQRGKFRLADLLSSGKQTVIPPSIHPDTGSQYRYITDQTLLDINPMDLPEISKEIIDLIHELKEFNFDDKTNVFFGHNGRHDKVVSYAFAVIRDLSSAKELTEKMIEYDKKKHPDAPYFEDKIYIKNKSGYDYAFALAKRIEKSFIGIMKKQGKDWSFGATIEKEKEEIGVDGFYMPVEKTNKETGESYFVGVPLFKKMAEHFKDVGEMVCSGNGDYIFENGYWQFIEDLGINNMITEMNRKWINPPHIDSFKKMIRSYCFSGDRNFESTEMKINLSNGIYDLKNLKIINHSKNYFFKYKMPIEFKPNEQCLRWIEFLNFVFKGNQELILAAQKIFGYCMIGGDPFLHRAFVLYGEGRNGKSTFIKVLRSILGKDSVSAVSMANLNRPFSVVRMDGKLANIVEETPTDEINSEIFKSLVGGGTATASFKGKDEFDMEGKCRFIFACNEMPKFNDRGESMLDRLFMIPFEVYIPENERDTTIDKKLESEYSGILNWAIEGAKLILADRKIETPHISKRLKEQYRFETDSVYSWIENHIDFENIEPISCNQAYLNYKVDIENSGQYPVSKEKFAKRFKKICMELRKGKIEAAHFNGKVALTSDVTKRLSWHRGYSFFKYCKEKSV